MKGASSTSGGRRTLLFFCHTAWHVEIELVPLAVETRSLNHWAAREVLKVTLIARDRELGLRSLDK